MKLLITWLCVLLLLTIHLECFSLHATGLKAYYVKTGEHPSATINCCLHVYNSIQAFIAYRQRGLHVFKGAHSPE